MAQINPDFNGDGEVNPADVSRFIAAWWQDGSVGTTVTDADGDGAITPADVAIFMQLWLAAVEQPARGGWTPLEPPAGARLVYVSSSDGKATNDGLKAKTPLLTLAQGVALLRDGYPDQLLLKKGDTWIGETFGDFRQSGRSSTERMVISAYGVGARPKVIAPAGTTVFSRTAGGTKGDLAIVGIHFIAATGGNYADVAMDWIAPNVPYQIQDVLLEDCRFSRFAGLGNFQCFDGLTIRRCIFEDLWTIAPASRSTWAYFDYCKNLLIEENYIVNRVIGVRREPASDATGSDAVFYINEENAGPTVVRRNIVTIKGPYGPIGFKVRCDATIDDNILDGLNNAIQVGATDVPPSGFWPNGTVYHIGGNVVERAGNLNSRPDGGRGVGIVVSFTRPTGSIVENNILANKAVASEGTAIDFDQGYAPGFARNVTLRNNILFNFNGFQVQRGNAAAAGLSFTGNFVQNPGQAGSDMPLVDVYSNSPLVVSFAGNTYNSLRVTTSWFRVADVFVPKADWAWIESSASFQAVSYPDPTRSLPSYMQSLGLPATEDAVIDAFLTQSRDSWNVSYTIDSILAYFRAGFGR